MCRNVRRRTWLLSKLKRFGSSSSELIDVYKTYIRPMAEYLLVAWHSSVTAEQDAAIEKEQVQALRHIYGWGLSTNKMREQSGLELLSSSRRKATNRFAHKCARNPRFEKYFEERKTRHPSRPTHAKYYERTARTDRFRNLPYNYSMIRTQNDLS